MGVTPAMSHDPNKLYVEIKLRDGYGKVHAVIAEEVPREVAYRGPRIGEDVRAGFYAFGASNPMAETVKVLQVREMRRKLFRDLFPRLAERMADFLYDREGWSDPSRQATTERLAREAE